MDGIANFCVNVLIYISKQWPNHPDFPAVLKKWFHIEANKCQMCIDRGNAVGYCRQCHFLLDNQCIKYHGKIIHLRNHEVIDWQRDTEIRLTDLVPRLICSVNSHRQCELHSYCTICKILVCQICSREHVLQNHTVNRLEDFFELLELVINANCIMEDIITCLPQEDKQDDIDTLSTLVMMINMVIYQEDISGSTFFPKVKTMLENPANSMPGVATIEESRRMMNMVNTELSAIRQSFDPRMPSAETGPMSARQSPDVLLQFDTVNEADDCQIPSSITLQRSLFFIIDRSDALHSSLDSVDLFPSSERHMQATDDSGTDCQKTPEQEIKALQYDVDNAPNLDSFTNIHPPLQR